MSSFSYGKIEKAIGRVTLNFCSLEDRIASLIAFLLNEHNTEVGIAITAELPFRQSLGLLQNIFKHKGGDQKEFKKLNRVLRRAEKIADKRNTIIHSFWIPIPSLDEQYIRKKDRARYKKNSKGIQKQSEIIKVEEILKIADEILNIAGEIYQFELDRSILD